MAPSILTMSNRTPRTVNVRVSFWENSGDNKASKRMVRMVFLIMVKVLVNNIIWANVFRGERYCVGGEIVASQDVVRDRVVRHHTALFRFVWG